jgi:hypothetical protein
LERLRQEKAAWEAQGIKAYRFTAKVLLNMPTRPVSFAVGDEIETIENETPVELDSVFGKTTSDIYRRSEDQLKKQNAFTQRKGIP